MWGMDGGPKGGQDKTHAVQTEPAGEPGLRQTGRGALTAPPRQEEATAVLTSGEISRLLSGWDIITFANDWEGDPLSKKHFMKLVAEHSRVLWVNSLGNRTPKASASDLKRIVNKLGSFFREHLGNPEQNIYVLRPLALPLFGLPWAEKLNRHMLGMQIRAVMRKLGFQKTLIWSFHPSAAWIMGAVNEDAVMYHCVDEFSAFAGAPTESILELEARLAVASNLVICCSAPLYERKKSLNPKTFMVRHGVDVAHFRKALDSTLPIPEDLAQIPEPRVGFFGLIAEWIDQELMGQVARLMPDVSFVYIGKAAADTSMLQDGNPNVYLLGHRSYDLLPGYARGFAAAVLPFARGELADSANPLKLREYLAAGLPVVSTGIPEAVALEPAVSTADQAAPFVGHLRRILGESVGPSMERSRLMDNEDWEHKFSQIISYLAPHLSAQTESIE